MKLITEFAEKISEKLVHNGIVPKEDAPLYQYGIENAITVAGNLLASVIFGIITGRLGVVLVFLFFTAHFGALAEACIVKAKQGVSVCQWQSC